MSLNARSKVARAALLGGVIVGLGFGPAIAQQPGFPPDPAVRPSPQPKAAASPKAQPKAQAKATPKDETPAAKSTDSQLRQRVDQLEEQLADLQVTMGTLESLGKAGGGSPAAAGRVANGAGGGVDQARIDSLETQLRALAAQVEQLSAQLRQANRRGDLDPAQGHPAQGLAPGAGPAVAAAPGFGNVTVTPGGDPIGKLLEPAVSNGPAGPLPAAAQAAGSPKELYETAYGYLLQQDYGSAEVTFEDFLRRYPADRQAADAQYWYGETLYVQRRYKPAAQAFLKVADKYPASAKVPNSILKLAMTLEQLGQKDCGLFATLETGHPNAPADVKNRARALKQRIGC